MKKMLHTVLALSVSLALGHVNAAEKDEQKWQVDSPKGQFVDAAISVEQGTWMNIDVSPDGKTVVFDLLGDIYTMPMSGGTATKLTSDIAWQMQPRFSPNGKHIAFTSDQGGGDNIWIMDLNGENQHAVTDETFRLLNSPAWSPDGDYLVARKHFTASRSLGAGEVWLYHKAGGKGVQLTKRENDQKDLGEPMFSPDGRYVYFSHDATPGKTFHYSKDSVAGIYKIKRYDRETGEIETVIDTMGGAIRPTPSPDGKKLAYIKRDDFQTSLYLYDLSSGEHTKLYDKLERDMQETWAIHGVYPTIAWTPDNEELVFWAGGIIHKLDVADKSVKTIPFKVQTSKKIQKAVRYTQNLDTDEFDVKMLRNVQVSPDGETAIFEALGYIYKRDLESGKIKRLTKQTEHYELFPQYSRDGKKIVYTTWNDNKQGTVRVVSSRSGRGDSITTEPGKYVEPTFSPNGKTVVYRKATGGSILNPKWSLNPGIYSVSVKGGKSELISKNGYQPQFGDESDRVFIMSPWPKPTLSVVDLKSKKIRKLYESEHATEFRVSPDGQYLAFAERFKVFVTPFVESGSTINISPKDSQFPIEQLSARAGENISWNTKSNTLYWTLGPELYHASLEGMFAINKADDADFKVKSGDNIGFSKKMAKPKGMIALKGAKIITMDGEKVIENGVIITDGKHIKSIGTANEVTIPKDAKVIDVTGKTIMPGIVDAHAHGSQASDEIIPQQNWKNFAGLALGVTTIHDPSNDTTEIFTASEMQKAGMIVGPRIFSTGTILYGANMPGYTSHIDSLEDAKFHLERLKKVGAFSVKSYNQPRREQRQQVIEAGRELEMMVVPEGGSLLQHNLSMVVDGHTGIEHSIPVEHIYDDIKQLWSQSDVGYTPTLVVAYGGIWGENYWYDKTDVWNHPRLSKFVPKNQLLPRSMRRVKAPDHHYNHFNNARVAKELQDLGVLVNLGAHGQREGLGAHWEMWMFAQGGMSSLEAIRASTLDPAKYLGLDKNVGSLEVGKLADLMVIDGNPLKNIRDSDKVDYTMINGRLFDASTMNEVGKKEREPLYFE
ncbi:amidohydrolase family protein [Pseudoalteromonas carrageenovora]|uniref:amidohydrolase family protein n=1 Tax=Pseudoalteromonas TaxID=53246 RepID=UPI0007321D50|nr:MULTISPECIES: amidohydrolase family protein [Pseudoalteromonas]KTF11800.1 amidohydrolase [Pseudoalteromonas sp. H103]MDO6635743.1 amidohydrolase family protein [Pseudoalteromonas carrageenovora]MDO6650406.1 amidohydrolase family protein [Pseudoalteromonas carrageenovora]